jgi:glyoxylase-like metal-dependent hydrolase (beta-lactamase superfamily II)
MITDISPSIRSILAPNPSPMTGSGTNTYVIQGSQGAVIIDPGPDLAAHRAALIQAIHDTPIMGILTTHAHIDHTELAPWLSAQTGAPVMSFGGADLGRRSDLDGLASGEGVDVMHKPDLFLADGQIIDLGDHQIMAMHTPGHMGGHMCFACGDILFSGDHVMAWSSSVVAPPDGDMAQYRASLSKLTQGPWRQFWPGHGPVVRDPARRLQELIDHRAKREAMILAALPPQGATADWIARLVYSDISPDLLPAATQNVLAHLIDLANRKHIAARAKLSLNVIFDRL